MRRAEQAVAEGDRHLCELLNAEAGSDVHKLGESVRRAAARHEKQLQLKPVVPAAPILKP